MKSFLLRILFVAGELTAAVGSRAQSSLAGSPPAQASVIPPGPQAAALGRYGEVPVNLFTGTPAIAVPLLQFGPANGVKVPLGLDYRATGIRMDDVGGWTGIGWNLEAGGVVARTVHGLPDELPGRGYLAVAARMDAYDQHRLSAAEEHVLLDMAARNVWDLEPDVYSFNFPGGSGQFVLDHAGVPVLVPYQKIAVARRDSAGTPGFVLTAEDGTRYVFLDAETTSVEPQGTDDPPFTFVSSWHLTRIEPLLGPALKYEYDHAGNVLSAVNETETIYYKTYESIPGAGKDLPRSLTHSQSSVSTLVLARMSTANQEALFYSSARQDLDGGMKLDSVRIQNTLGTAVKRFAFRYAPAGQASNPTERLKLREVQELGSAGDSPPFRFTYNPQGLPLPDGRNLKQDYWGYYNNNPAQTLIPSMMVTQFDGNRFYPGADRQPDFVKTQGDMLTQIQYPTGGSVAFEYEPHDYGFHNAAPVPPQIVTAPRTVAVSAHVDPSATGAVVLQDEATFRVASTQVVRVAGFLNLGSNRFFNDTGSEASILFTCLTCPRGTAVGGLWTENNLPPMPPPANTPPSGTPPPVRAATVYIDEYQQLVPGTYRMAIDLVNTSIRGVRGTLTITYGDSTGVEKRKITGGLRIRRTIAHSGNGAPDAVREYRYRMEDEPDRSSGCVASELPPFTYGFRTEDGLPGSAGAFGSGTTVTTGFTVATGQGLSQPGAVQGSPIGYREITVLDDVNGSNGQTVTKFLSAADPGLASGSVGYFPFAPNPKREYVWGKPRQVTTFRTTNGAVLPVEQHRTAYAYHPPAADPAAAPAADPAAATRVLGYKVGYVFNSQADGLDVFRADPYHYTSEWVHPAQAVERHYDPLDTARYQETRTVDRYANAAHARLTGRVVYAGPDTLVTRYTYPLDYPCPAGPLSGPAGGIQRLQAAHALAVPIEEQRWRRVGRDSVLLAGTLTEYEGVVAKRRLALATAVPLLSTAATASAVTPRGEFIRDRHYQERLVVDRYNPDGTVLQQHLTAAPPTAYLWGYDRAYPIAEVTNAAYSTVAYTSFEPHSPGQWAYDEAGKHRVAGGRTGAWAYRLDGTAPVARNGLAAGNYELQCWTKGGLPVLIVDGGTAGVLHHTAIAGAADWQQHRFQLRLTANGTVSIDAAGGAVLVDELRLCPVGAQMSTYTYDPLAGMTSHTDPSGRTLTYEYDALGRLVRTRDEQGRILSQQQYHYARRP